MKLRSIVTAALLLGSAAGAMAVQVVVVGVKFNIVYDPTELGKYGVPSFGAGDSILWNAPTVPFVAGAPGSRTFSATTKFQLVAHTGVILTGITYAESGTYNKPGTTGIVSGIGSVQIANITPPAASFTADFTTGGLPTTGASTRPWSATTGLVALPSSPVGVTLTFTDALKAFGGSTSITQTGSSLLVTTVPEPETYALMLSGLFAVGSLAHRRRQG